MENLRDLAIEIIKLGDSHAEEHDERYAAMENEASAQDLADSVRDILDDWREALEDYRRDLLDKGELFARTVDLPT